MEFFKIRNSFFTCALLAISYSALSAQGSPSETSISDLENRLFDIELEMSEKKPIVIDGMLQTIYRSTSRKEDDAHSRSNTDEFTSSLFVSFEKKDQENLKVYTTIGAEYFWNNNTQSTDYVLETGQIELRGTYMFVQKAYFDYFFNDKKFALSVGRLPTVDGPPIEKHLGQERLGTYPILLYSLPLDGVALTTNLKNLFSLDDRHILRFIYTPFFSLDTSGRPNSVGSSSSQLSTNKGEAIFLNYETSGEVENLFNYSFILQGFRANLMRMEAIEARGLANELCEAGGSAGAICGSSPSRDGNLYEVYSEGGRIATMEAILGHIDLQNILDSNISYYLSYKLSKFISEGRLKADLIEQNNGGAAPVGTSLGEIGGFIYDQDEEAEEFLTGLNYSNKTWTFGFEYLKRSIGALPGILSSSSITDFYSNVGHGNHFYMNHKLERNFSVTVGYMDMLEELAFQGLNYQKSNTEVKTLYTNLTIDF